MLFDWLITGQVVPDNPAAAVRGPKHVMKTGKTPVLDAKEWRTLLDSIPTATVRDLRDRGKLKIRVKLVTTASGGCFLSDYNGLPPWPNDLQGPSANSFRRLAAVRPEMDWPMISGEACVFNDIADAVGCPQRPTFLDGTQFRSDFGL
jgi:hypothetical protein